MSEEQNKSPLQEIVQPFVDLVRAPRALWGVNLAYVLEGMVYFGMLGYLAIHFSDFIFQGIEHADESAHYNVGFLTAGITLAMLFLGSVADKWGIRFALIAAFVCMLCGRMFMSGAPNVLGLEPARPGVMVGDQVSLHISELTTRDGNKTIAEATVFANDEGGADVTDVLAIDLAAGEGVVPTAELESKLVRVSEATVISGEENSWLLQYGSAPVTARLLARSAKDQCISPGAVISLDSAYVTARKDNNKRDADETAKEGEAAEQGSEDRESYEYVIRCHWSEEFTRVDVSQCVNEDDAKILLGIEKLRPAEGEDVGELVTKLLETNKRGALADRVAGIVRSTEPALWGSRILRILQSTPPPEGSQKDAQVCEPKPGSHEKDQRATERWALDDTKIPETSTTATIAELRSMDDGPVDIVLDDVYVSYVRNGGYFLQAERNGSAIFAFVNPVWSPLHVVTLLGMVLVVIGYGMYQPAAYAAVRQFTTPKTAAMGFAMLYALMNLGGYLPSWAFMLRDENWLGLGIPGTYWVYTGITLIALFVTVVILSRKTVAAAIERAKAETAEIEAAEEKAKPEEKPEETPEEKPAVVEIAPAQETGARVPPVHMWVFILVSLVAIHWRVSEPWNYYVCAILGVAWLVACGLPASGRWLAKHPLADAKFFFFIFALIPVQTLFTYNWFILPQYISRAFEGWIGEYFELAANANPILIFIAVPLIAAATQKAKVYNMMIYGTFIMAAPAFLLAIGPYAWTLVGYLLIMTIGEAMWQPRFLQYAAEIAPEGRTGQYMGVAQLPWFMTKMLVPALYSGWMMDRYCPAEGIRNTELMWFYFGCIAITSTIMLIVAKGWVGRGFKTSASK